MPLSRAELKQLNWRKANLSMNNGDCVEVAQAPGFVAIRDSKDPDGAILSCLSGSFRSFLETVKSGALRPKNFGRWPTARSARSAAIRHSTEQAAYPALPENDQDQAGIANVIVLRVNMLEAVYQADND